MGLPPLEYIDCFLDSPNFREIITLYEKELDSNSQYVKTLVKECRNMITATEGEGEGAAPRSPLPENMAVGQV